MTSREEALSFLALIEANVGALKRAIADGTLDLSARGGNHSWTSLSRRLRVANGMLEEAKQMVQVQPNGSVRPFT